MVRQVIAKICDMLFGPSIEPRWYVCRIGEKDGLAAQMIVAGERSGPLAEFFQRVAAKSLKICGCEFCLWGAFSSDGELIGVLMFCVREDAPNIDLIDLVVLPSWRGIGVGSALLSKAITRAQETERIVAGLFRSRDFAALRWLKNRGFAPVRCGDRPLIVDDLFGPGVDGYGMAHVADADDRVIVRIAE